MRKICSNCGQERDAELDFSWKYDVRILEFDHVRGNKTANVIKLLMSNNSWQTIENEIAKCEVRCVNCHRIKTSEKGHWWRTNKLE